jgi:hypothetical protein
MNDIDYRKTRGINAFIQFLYSKLYKVNILVIFLISLGIFLFWMPLGLNHQFSITLFLIAVFIFFFFPRKRDTSIRYNIEYYIFYVLIGWLIIMFFITIDIGHWDVFFISVVFGMLIIKECANGYLTPPLKKKLSILILVFFSFSMILIAITILSYFFKII